MTKNSTWRNRRNTMSDLLSEKQLAAAWSGDRQAFSDLTEPYRSELLVHCYRLLGSEQDAEDMVQETFLRAWNRLESFTGGQYFRAWLYKIATNICLDALDKRSRRVLPPSNFRAADPHGSIAPAITEPVWLEPFPDELLPDVALGPEAHYTLRESITLAFLAALQFLPPRQRVILILCDVLDWHAKEAADLLDISVAAVNGLLRRARSTMNNKYHENEPVLTIDKKIRNTMDRYVEAWESGNVEKLISLLADKVVFTMPPSPTWFSGREAVRIHAETMFSRPEYSFWRLQQTRANNQIAFAGYLRQESDGLYHAHVLQVLTFDGAQITEIHAFFLPQIFQRFSLAMTL
jgi:RNA polymerase sigma-70 factor, ECF subfamily